LSPTLATKGRNEPSLTTNQRGGEKEKQRAKREGNDQQTRGKLPPTRGKAPMKKKNKSHHMKQNKISHSNGVEKLPSSTRTYTIKHQTFLRTKG
jgi:hypothetical protein